MKIPLRNEAGEIDSYIGLSTDITEQKRLEHQVRSYNDALQTKIKEVTDLKDTLEYQATHDVLTGLFNRRMLETLSEKIFVPDNPQLVGMLMLDLDHFKRVNDEFGHKTGDDVICLLAQLMSDECRSSDVICRYGGEEFVLLMPGTQAGKARAKAEWLRKRYCEVAGQIFPDMGTLTLSVGFAEAPANNVSFEQLYLVVDKALYQAKENGRNRCEEGQLQSLTETVAEQS
ncbi:GGDEF domain-containing protein [Aliamphritea spongicola]